MHSIDDVLIEISTFSLDDKELIAEIIQKRIIEEKRQNILENYKKSFNAYQKGETQTGDVDDLFQDLKK